jgi:hypothetical protein
MTSKYSLFIAELFLGLALGTGYLTSFRFTDTFGISEVFYIFFVSIMIIKYGKKLIAFKNHFFGFFSLYFVFNIWIVAPIVTLLIKLFMHDVLGSAPIYIISFMFASLLYIIMFNAIIVNVLNMQVVTTVFFLSFVFLNLFIGSPLKYLDVSDVSRYSGGANNPNQLGFYGTSLLFMLLMYVGRLKVILIIIVCSIVMLSRSDSFALSLFTLLVAYIFLSLFNFSKISTKLNLYLYCLIFILFGLSLLYFWSKDILLIWESADEGNARVELYINSIRAVFSSPLFGLGIGSFSGLNGPFEGWEAHNTFLDLAMQFGVVFPFIIYLIFFKSVFHMIANKSFLLSSFLIAFIVNSLFHFSGRHFNFWIELAIISSYLYLNPGNLNQIRNYAHPNKENGR